MTDPRGMNCNEFDRGPGRDKASRDLIIAKTASLLESLPTATLIELLCEIARLSPPEPWPGLPPGAETPQWVLHRSDP
jgi:hypothetical protein